MASNFFGSDDEAVISLATGTVGVGNCTFKDYVIVVGIGVVSAGLDHLL